MNTHIQIPTVTIILTEKPDLEVTAEIQPEKGDVQISFGSDIIVLFTREQLGRLKHAIAETS